MAAPSTQSPPLGLPSDAVQFLQDSLHPSYTQITPTLANPYQDYENGVTIGDQLNNAVLSGLHAQQAQQSIAASQAAAQLAAAKSPYELAFLEARKNELGSKGNKEDAQANNYGKPSPTIAPFSFQSQVQPTVPAAPSTDATLPAFSPGSLSTPDFSLDNTSGTADDAPTPLLGAVTPSPDTSLATTLPTSGDNIGALLDRLDQTDPTNATLSDTPDQTTTATSYDLPNSNTFTAKATGYFGAEDPQYQKNGQYVDAQGNPLHTLDAFRRGEVPDVTISVDRKSPLFGKTGYSQDLQAPVRFTDTGGDFTGKGTSRVDVARDNSAGAHADENNGNLTFTVNDGGDVANGPLVAVHDADSASGATVYQGGQQISGAGVVVPKSQDKLTAQRNAFNQWSAQANAALSQTSNPRQQNAIKAQIANTTQALRQSEQLFLASQKRGTASVTPTGVAADVPADIDGYQKTDLRSTGGKLGARYVTDAQAASEQRAQGIKDINDAQELIGKQTGGATLNEFLNATPNQDGSFTVTHIDNDKGIDIPIQRTLPAPFYNQLANIARPAVFGNPKPTANTGSDTDAKIAALATDPEFGGRTDNVLPTGLTPMNLVLGSRVMSSIPRPTYAPPVIPSVQSKLQQATASLPASDDPLEQLGGDADAVGLPGRQAVALGNQEITDTRNSKAAIMQRQIEAAKSDYDRQRAATQEVADGLDPYSGGAPYSVTAKTQASQALREARAKYLAAQDPDNYTLGANGVPVYVDPFRTNSSYAGGGGLTGQVNGATLTLRAQ